MCNQVGRIRKDYSLFSNIIKLLIVGLLLTTCSSKPDLGFWGDNSCAAPCWYNITPGVTVEKDALSILQSSKNIQQDSLRERTYDNLDIQEYSFRFQQNSFVSVATQNDIVYRIHLTPSFNLSLQELIDQFGEPKYLFAETNNGGPISYYITLYYPEQGIVLRALWGHIVPRYEDVPRGMFKIEGDLELEGIYYFEQDKSLEWYLEKIGYFNEEQVQLILPKIMDWNGFGVYTAPAP